jgi:hypothetical protein
MKKLIYILLTLSTQMIFAQAPSKIWDKTIGGNDYDFATAIVATTDGGFVLVGPSSSGISGDKTEANRGGINEFGFPYNDYWVVKINSLGQKVWDKTFGGNGEDFATSVVATNDGGFVIAGYSNSGISGDKTQASKGLIDFWVIKINGSGLKEWDKTIGGNNNDWAFSITTATDGGFVIAGDSSSDISGDKTEANPSSSIYGDYWVVKLSSTGIKVWDKQISGPSFDSAKSITTTTDGGFVVVGNSPSGIGYDKTEASRGQRDYWIVKLNSTGQIVWNKTIGGNKSDDPSAVVASNDGGFVIIGNSNSDISSEKTEANKGSDDYWVVKINSSGQKVWDKTLGGSGLETAKSLIALADGSFILAGSSESNISGDKTEVSIGFEDYWLVKIDNLGQKIWDKTFGSSTTDKANSIAASADGGFVIAGVSDGGISGNKTEVGNGDYDYWIVKINDSITLFETIATGNFNANGTWNTNTPPTATKTAKINATHTVNIPNAGNQVKTIQMNGGNINLTGGTLEIKNQ